MGKFRVKPTRAVSKPFKNPFNRNRSSSSSVIVTKITQALSESSLLPSERPTTSATASHSKIEAEHAPISILSKVTKRKSQRQKKCVSFSKNLTTEEILKSSETVQFVPVPSSSARLNPKVQGNSKVNYQYVDAKASASNMLNNGLQLLGDGVGKLKKIVKKEIKGKKGRLRVRKELFKQKLSLIRTAEEQSKAAARRQQTVIVGDMEPLAKILEELQEQDEEEKAKKISNNVVLIKKKTKKSTAKKRQQELLDGLKFFEAAGL